jgi:hypothetical protein
VNGVGPNVADRGAAGVLGLHPTSNANADRAIPNLRKPFLLLIIINLRHLEVSSVKLNVSLSERSCSAYRSKCKLALI